MATSTPSTSTSKRHSLAISTGPKPLHLTPGPSTAPHSSLSFNTNTNTTPPYTPLSARPYSLGNVKVNGTRHGHGNGKGKRQSSISYISSSDGVYSERNAALGRSNSLLARREDRRSSVPPSASAIGGEGEKKRPPLTLAEKHADLLHFIAQKESKCLELRSQLAVHEAELLQLKRKWERIVNRGFERDLSSSSSSPPNSAPLPGATNSNTNATLVDGIKEGVQGLNRLFNSTSLSQSQGQQGYPPSPATTPPLLRTQIRKQQHETKQSISTTSSCSYTSANTSKSRFSLSSTSSIGEEKLGDKEKEEEVLIVRDTGATPTMSPNPDWAKRVGEREVERLSLEEESKASAVARKGLRRRSGGVVSPPPKLELEEDGEEEEEKKRVVAPVSAPLAGGWVESMGKKIGELRGGAGFTKSQKRASLLISDVSQSFMSVISTASSPASSMYTPVPSAYTPYTSKPTSTSNSNSKPSSLSLKPTSSLSLKPSNSTSTSSPKSLLDDDDDFTFTSSSNPILQPSPALRPPMVPTRKAALEAGKGKGQEEEDEWNW